MLVVSFFPRENGGILCRNVWSVLENKIYVSEIRPAVNLEEKKQHYALIVPSFIYFYVLAPTCFGSSLPSSGSLFDFFF
jgi:hypothetical protein